MHKLDDVLLHFGVKGMKWDEKKAEEQVDGAKKKAKAISNLVAKRLKGLKKKSKKVASNAKATAKDVKKAAHQVAVADKKTRQQYGKDFKRDLIGTIKDNKASKALKDVKKSAKAAIRDAKDFKKNPRQAVRNKLGITAKEAKDRAGNERTLRKMDPDTARAFDYYKRDKRATDGMKSLGDKIDYIQKRDKAWADKKAANKAERDKQKKVDVPKKQTKAKSKSTSDKIKAALKDKARKLADKVKPTAEEKAYYNKEAARMKEHKIERNKKIKKALGKVAKAAGKTVDAKTKPYRDKANDARKKETEALKKQAKDRLKRTTAYKEVAKANNQAKENISFVKGKATKANNQAKENIAVVSNKVSKTKKQAKENIAFIKNEVSKAKKQAKENVSFVNGKANQVSQFLYGKPLKKKKV